MRPWIISLVVCVLLLAAWPLRWENHESARDGMLVEIHVRDRWIGQWWSVNPHTGMTEPKISNSLIEQRAARLEQEQPELVKARVREQQEWLQRVRVAFPHLDLTHPLAGRPTTPAERLAAQRLVQEAWNSRNLATGGWAALIAGSFVAAVVLYRREQVQETQAAPNKEAVE